mmetsp:Transcript_72270/g.156166  ORF Transcript_72270/g.156166 Transcript_72270/m.156166 type:complete len:360 (+) Transcript_72270:1204-2283(+)
MRTGGRGRGHRCKHVHLIHPVLVTSGRTPPHDLDGIALLVKPTCRPEHRRELTLAERRRVGELPDKAVLVRVLRGHELLQGLLAAAAGQAARRRRAERARGPWGLAARGHEHRGHRHLAILHLAPGRREERRRRLRQPRLVPAHRHPPVGLPARLRSLGTGRLLDHLCRRRRPAPGRLWSPTGGRVLGLHGALRRARPARVRRANLRRPGVSVRGARRLDGHPGRARLGRDVGVGRAALHLRGSLVVPPRSAEHPRGVLLNRGGRVVDDRGQVGPGRFQEPVVEPARLKGRRGRGLLHVILRPPCSRVRHAAIALAAQHLWSAIVGGARCWNVTLSALEPVPFKAGRDSRRTTLSHQRT